MKKTSIIPFIVILYFVSTVVHGAEIWEEFSGIRWGTPLAALQGLQENRTDDYVQYFVRPEEQYSIDDLVLGGVIYGFYQEKFYAAFINLTSRSQFDQTMKLLQLKYGKPRANLRLTQTTYIWDYQQLKIKLKHDKKNESFKLGFYHTPLSEALNQQRIGEGDIKLRKLYE